MNKLLKFLDVLFIGMVYLSIVLIPVAIWNFDLNNHNKLIFCVLVEYFLLMSLFLRNFPKNKR